MLCWPLPTAPGACTKHSCARAVTAALYVSPAAPVRALPGHTHAAARGPHLLEDVPRVCRRSNHGQVRVETLFLPGHSLCSVLMQGHTKHDVPLQYTRVHECMAHGKWEARMRSELVFAMKSPVLSTPYVYVLWAALDQRCTCWARTPSLGHETSSNIEPRLCCQQLCRNGRGATASCGHAALLRCLCDEQPRHGALPDDRSSAQSITNLSSYLPVLNPLKRQHDACDRESSLARQEPASL